LVIYREHLIGSKKNTNKEEPIPRAQAQRRQLVPRTPVRTPRRGDLAHSEETDPAVSAHISPGAPRALAVCSRSSAEIVCPQAQGRFKPAFSLHQNTISFELFSERNPFNLTWNWYFLFCKSALFPRFSLPRDGFFSDC
jgi:hypothetical protein